MLDQPSPTPFTLSEEQHALREMVAAFTADRIAPHALDWDEHKHFPVDVIRAAAALGLGGILVREESGGSALSRLDAVLCFEALAEGCPTIAAYISIHNMVASMVDRFGSDAQRERYLPGLCGMERLASYCLTEANAGSDAAALRTRARREGDAYVLDGQKQFISGAGTPGNLYVVMARTGGEGASGVSAFLIEDGTPGLSFGAQERKMGWNAQPTAAVILDACRVPVTSRLGAEGEGFKIAMRGLDGGRLNIGACSLGGASSALAKAQVYMGERKAFGAPLDQLQALRFRVAAMATKLEAARSLLWRAAAALDAGDPRATELCAMAKLFSTDAGFEVANDALQLHGGYGYLSAYGIEKIVRDLRVHQILEGTNEIMHRIIARAALG